jgi:hypothetical protein
MLGDRIIIAETVREVHYTLFIDDITIDNEPCKLWCVLESAQTLISVDVLEKLKSKANISNFIKVYWIRMCPMNDDFTPRKEEMDTFGIALQDTYNGLFSYTLVEMPEDEYGYGSVPESIEITGFNNDKISVTYEFHTPLRWKFNLEMESTTIPLPKYTICELSEMIRKDVKDKKGIISKILESW